jgi:hypothetical protein
MKNWEVKKLLKLNLRAALFFSEQEIQPGSGFRRLEGFDLEIRDQNEKIAQLRRENTEINKYISYLDGGFRLNKEEELKLADEIYELFSPHFPSP